MTMTGDDVTTFFFGPKANRFPAGIYVKHEDYLRLRQENERLRVSLRATQAELDKLSLAYIEASNPGIDMDEVRASMERTTGEAE